MQILSVGEAPPTSSQNVPVFSAALVDTLDISHILGTTFGSVDPNNSLTFPSPATIEGALASVQGILDAGDASVPVSMSATWFTAWFFLRQIFFLATGGYDLNGVPLEFRQAIVGAVVTPTRAPRRLRQRTPSSPTSTPAARRASPAP